MPTHKAALCALLTTMGVAFETEETAVYELHDAAPFVAIKDEASRGEIFFVFATDGLLTRFEIRG